MYGGAEKVVEWGFLKEQVSPISKILIMPVVVKTALKLKRENTAHSFS